MKKSLFLGLGALAMLASCSSDEVIDRPNPMAIGFNTFVNNGTRSIDPSLTTADLTGFNVWGWQITGDNTAWVFDQAAVTKKGTEFESNPLQYWTANSQYYFAALNADATRGDFDAQNNFIPLTVDYAVSSQKDLLYATATATVGELSTCPVPVGLTFNHMLSKVKFTFKNSVTSTSEIKISDIKITNAAANGTLAITNAAKTWTIATDDAGQSLDFGGMDLESGNIEYTKTAGSEFEKLLIPEADKVYEIEFTAELFQNGISVETKTFKVELTTTLQLGFCYNFVAELTKDSFDGLCEILFTVDKIEDWTQGDDVPFYPEVEE